METIVSAFVVAGALGFFGWMLVTAPRSPSLPVEDVRRLGLMAGMLGASFEQAAIAKFALERTYDGKTSPSDYEMATALTLAKGQS